MTLVEQAQATLRRASEVTGHDLFNEPVVLGVSGGPDSLSLLHVIRAIRSPKGLIVAHLDHSLRPGSAKEAMTVAAAADGLRFYSNRVDVAAMAQAQRLSLEEAGRKARYDFLASVARQEEAAAVIVGHNAGDQAETILMHFLRGSGLSGLAGMRAISPLAGYTGVWLVRPLLHATRSEIEAYCIEHNLDPIIDATNIDPVFFRNRLRHELLPLLESYNPQIHQRLQHMGEVIAADEDLLRDLTASAWSSVVLSEPKNKVVLDRDAWLALPLALRRRTLRRAIGVLRPDLRDISYRTLESARSVAEQGGTGAIATLPAGVILQVGYGKLLMTSGASAGESEHPQLSSEDAIPLPIPGKISLAMGWQITAEWVYDIDLQTITANDDLWVAYLDTGPNALHVRPRLRGERMRPLGLDSETKLKEIMINRKIPASARRYWPIIATENHAVWLVGHVVDNRARVRPDSGRMVRLRCVHADRANLRPVDAPPG